jgi:hypothetical protein
MRGLLALLLFASCGGSDLPRRCRTAADCRKGEICTQDPGSNRAPGVDLICR